MSKKKSERPPAAEGESESETAAATTELPPVLDPEEVLEAGNPGEVLEEVRDTPPPPTAPERARRAMPDPEPALLNVRKVARPTPLEKVRAWSNWAAHERAYPKR
jgi:hypothetical protein